MIGRLAASQAGPSGSRSIDSHPLAQNIIHRDRKASDEKPDWLKHKEALRRNFPDGWNPPKKISRPSMTLLRTLHKTDPAQFSLPVLSQKFKISPEAVRRILRSKWEPDRATSEKLQASAETATSLGSSDGWIHHERLETDRIPRNLAQTLQSSLPHNPSHSSSQRDSSNSSNRFTQSKPGSRRYTDVQPDRQPPESNTTPSDPGKLGSAVQPSPLRFTHGRRRRVTDVTHY